MLLMTNNLASKVGEINMTKNHVTVVLTFLLAVGGLACSNGSPNQASMRHSPKKPLQQVLLQGKILNKLTGKPVKYYGCMVRVELPKSHNGERVIVGWNHNQSFKMWVKPGKYYLVLSEIRSTSSVEIPPSLPMRTEWTELVGTSRTPFRVGNRIEVEAKAGQIRTFLFRLRTADRLN